MKSLIYVSFVMIIIAGCQKAVSPDELSSDSDSMSVQEYGSKYR